MSSTAPTVPPSSGTVVRQHGVAVIDSALTRVLSVLVGDNRRRRSCVARADAVNARLSHHERGCCSVSFLLVLCMQMSTAEEELPRRSTLVSLQVAGKSRKTGVSEKASKKPRRSAFCSPVRRLFGLNTP